MAIKSFTPEYFVSQAEMNSVFIQDYLQSFIPPQNIDLTNGTVFNFIIRERAHKKKINPVIRKATFKDIEEIIYIYQDIYEGSYPYKEMEDPENIKAMLESENVEWLMFEHPKTREICGCFTLVLDFKDKMGYTRGFVIKKKFCGKFDVLRAFMASFLAMYLKYEDKIFRWYGESRTAHAKSQYCMRPGGFRPVAFYPNKDLFFHKVESDILLMCYDSSALGELRSKKFPHIIKEALPAFNYSNAKYLLGDYEIFQGSLHLDSKYLIALQKKLRTEVVKNKYGYEEICFRIEGSDAFFSFLYTPMVQNLEKTQYHVNSNEELFVFGQEFIRYARKLKLRYFEVFVKAYRPEHQQIFFDLGFNVNGYVPSWKFNESERKFEDYILFNYNLGEIDPDIQLLEEGRMLLEKLGYM